MVASNDGLLFIINKNLEYLKINNNILSQK